MVLRKKFPFIILLQAIILIAAILFLPSTLNYFAEEREMAAEKIFIEKTVNASLPLFDNMPAPKVEVWWSDIYFRYADCVAFCTPGRTIVFSHSYAQGAGESDLRNTVKHEMTHAWVFWKGLESNIADGHNEAFLTKAGQVGIDLSSVYYRYPETRKIVLTKTARLKR